MRYRRSNILFQAPGLVIGIGAALIAAGYSVIDLVPGATLIIGGSCNIKGNISIETGERIFHVPGQEYYSATKISPQYGERWFCSEAEAWAAGWRKARN